MSLKQEYPFSLDDALNVLSNRAMLQGKGFNQQNIHTMAELLAHPEKKFPSIHVAGTNGKGSVCLKLAKILEISGFKCGLFTSPHIANFRERIKINSEMIPEYEMTSLLDEILSAERISGITLSYFECCTFLAFLYFAQEKVDVAVIEVGLGGRLDATNIIFPLLSIITSISKDHTDLLGETDEEIAEEKAGIIKPCTPVLIGPRTPHKVFHNKAKLLNAPLIALTENFSHYGLENRAIANAATTIIESHFPLTTEAKSIGLEIEPPCRFETIRSKLVPDSLIVFDVAHNPDGILRLIQRLVTYYPKKKAHFALSFSTNKDISTCAEILSSYAQSIFILDVEHHRLSPPLHTRTFFTHSNIPTEIGTAEKLVNEVAPKMTSEDILIVCGSFFIMDAVKKLL